MRKYFFGVVVGLIAIGTMVINAHAVQEIDSLQQIISRLSAFELTVNLNWTQKNNWAVNKTGQFYIECKGNQNEVFDLFVFQDNITVKFQKAIQMPYLYKQNFSGTNPGTYTMIFVLRNQAGQYGWFRQIINVSHN